MAAYRVNVTSDTSSDDDNNFELFLNKVRTPKPTKKYRLSNGSLSEFINDSVEASDSDNDIADALKIPSNTKTPKTSLSACKPKIRSSVVTPLKKIDFSSDSDDHVFTSPKSGEKVKVLKKSVTTPHKSIRFSSDSEISDEEFQPLSSRILKEKQPSSDFRARPPSLGSYKTPKSKPVEKLFQTEKIVKTKARCKIEGCFLTSLDSLIPENCGKIFRKNAADLTARLFKLFNSSVFENRLPETMEVSWSNRLTKTAGITKCKRTTRTQTGTEGRCISTHYDASISLSQKVIDSSYRLRDTLIHEMCHAAVWLLNNANESHGPYWKSWAARARRTHPELPSIDRCHNYDIEYKFIYECSRCKSTIGRHSKSIDIEKKLCGRCRGKLVLTKPCKTPGKLQNEKPLNPFASFVKENYKLTKLGLQSNLRADSHKDVMTALSEKFKTASLS